MTLKSWVKVTQYNIRTGLIRWQILTSIEVFTEHFSLDLAVFEIFTVMDSNIFYQIHLSSCADLSSKFRFKTSPNYYYLYVTCHTRILIRKQSLVKHLQLMVELEFIITSRLLTKNHGETLKYLTIFEL